MKEGIDGFKGRPFGVPRRLNRLDAGRLGIPMVAVLALLSGGCRDDMFNQPRYEPLEESELFEDGGGSQAPPPNTVARGQVGRQDALATGTLDGELVDTFPFSITAETLRRGREAFNIHCAVCHGRTGHGEGIIVRRGFPEPPSYHTDRLRDAPAGYFVNVISRGYGVMASYAARVKPRDRWAIAAYIRALQLSQHAPLDRVPEPQLEALKAERR